MMHLKHIVIEAEQNGIDGYGLYHWTKATIEDPLKKAKHLKSFAFYLGEDQIYPKELASFCSKSTQKNK